MTMSIALDLLKSLSAEGVEFSTDGVRIRWRNGDGRVTADVVAALAAEKAAVIDFLAANGAPPGTRHSARDPEDLRAEYEERAAILQYDGGLSREEAERQAKMGSPLPDKTDNTDETPLVSSRNEVLSVSSVLSEGGGTSFRRAGTHSSDLRRDLKLDPVSQPGDPEAYAEAMRVHGPMSYGMAMRVLGWGGTRAGQAETALRAAGRITLNDHGRAVLTGALS